MWDLYEKRIDQYLQEKHFDTRCHHQHSPVRKTESSLISIKSISVADSLSSRIN